MSVKALISDISNTIPISRRHGGLYSELDTRAKGACTLTQGRGEKKSQDCCVDSFPARAKKPRTGASARGGLIVANQHPQDSVAEM